ncbi:MAG: signal recognition particle-docking protein FtsY [Candidatus Micrarchaeota archaeon]|nr:signal recognition particle-docking protein FtsY [Candidatus Micrarchaeota archaeon]
MFDILKKKITGFIDNLTKKEEAKVESKIETKTEEKSVLIQQIKHIPELQPKPEVIKAPEKSKSKEIVRVPEPVKVKEEKKPELPKIKEEKAEKIIVKEEKKEVPKLQVKVEHKKTIIKPQPKEVQSELKIQESSKESKILDIPDPQITKPISQVHHIPEKKPEATEAKFGILKQIKSIFTGDVEISKTDIVDLLDGLELEMLESDVAMDVAEEIRKDLEIKLIGSKIRKSELNSFIKDAIRKSLLEVMTNSRIFDILEFVKAQEKPVKIMFLGINGSGKTTTIAKVTKMLLSANYKVVFAASDTFRAAAIEQLQVHADRLGVKMIKRDYGSDPTAVAYDAMSHAKANAIDVVLIDTAGRQETNLNLLNELKKMNRVIAPQLKVYIGESIAGNAIIQQVSEFNKEIGIDGVILTKLDCDAKGGTVLSISKTTGIPIIYLGTGQKYEDIEKFDAEKIVERILG